MSIQHNIIVLQWSRYEHWNACVPVWTNNFSGIITIHSSARLRLAVSILGLESICLLPLVHAYKLSTLGLIGQLKKKPWSPRDSRTQLKRKHEIWKVIYQLKPKGIIISKLLFFSSILNFFSPSLQGNEFVGAIVTKVRSCSLGFTWAFLLPLDGYSMETKPVRASAEKYCWQQKRENTLFAWKWSLIIQASQMQQ